MCGGKAGRSRSTSVKMAASCGEDYQIGFALRSADSDKGGGSNGTVLGFFSRL